MVDSWINCVVCGYRYKAFISTCPNCGTYNVDQPRKHTHKISIGAIVIAVIAIVLTTYIIVSFAQYLNLSSATSSKLQNEKPELPSDKDSQQPDLSNTSSQSQNEKPELPSDKDSQQPDLSHNTSSQSQNEKPELPSDKDSQQQQQPGRPARLSDFITTSDKDQQQQQQQRPSSSDIMIPSTSSQLQTAKAESVYWLQIFCHDGITITFPNVENPDTIRSNVDYKELCNSITTTTIINHGDLVIHALQLINKDRADFGLPPVKLSINQAAQIHAEDVYRTKQISHWMTNGEKPYMTYTRYNGMGSVSQNVSVDGYTLEDYAKCKSLSVICEKMVPTEEIKKLEHMLVYDDEKCCNNGHRDNILDPYHTHVSIGIAYDDYYFTMVQNFENNYGLHISEANGQVMVSGQLARGTLEQMDIYYDEMPTSTTYDLNKDARSYSFGEIVASVVRPPEPGYYYEQPEGYSLIIANDWTIEQNNSINVSFDLSQVAKKDGVYTILAFVKDNNGKIFEATSYSIFVKSDSTVR
ncbi:MAG: hypothetical protein C4292_07290 [Nitrososphaera sp.]